MEKTLIILRGLPSSGKTTFAQMLVDVMWLNPDVDVETAAVMFAADDYFSEDNPFHFSKLQAAHDHCRMNVSYAMTEDVPLIVVHNTNVKPREMRPYIKMAQDNGYRYFVLSLFDGGMTDAELAARNAHGVPEHTMKNMRRKFVHDWK